MQKIKILITGSNGCLGYNLATYFRSRGFLVIGTDLSALSVDPGILYVQGDLTDLNFIKKIIDMHKPNYIVNTVALVNLDECEQNKEAAYRVNVLTAENVAKVASEHQVKMVHVSTDHFFDGKSSFYKEDSLPSPVNNYGVTKLAAEQACLRNHPGVVVVRTNFYGWSHPTHRPTFGEWVYDSLAQKKPIRLFTDYYFTPIEVTALCEAIDLVLNSDFSGVINIAGAERCSKYEFGIALAEVFGLATGSVVPTKVKPEFFRVKRQQDLSLSIDRFARMFSMKLPDLKTGLERMKAAFPKGYNKNEK